MWSPSLALFTVCCYLVAFASSKIVTTSYSSGGPVKFSTSDVLLLSGETCRDQKFTLASVNLDGATVSFTFTGTGLTLNCMTDSDRGRYTITIDGSNSRTVSGISGARSCTAIYSVTGLPNTQHNFLLRTARQNLTSPSTDTSAKFEFMSFEVTVPDEPTPTTRVPPDSTPDNSTPTISTPNNGPGDDPSSTTSLTGGAIAGIVVGAILGIAAIVFGIFFYKRYQARNVGGAGPGAVSPTIRSNSIPPAPSPFTQHHQPVTSQYMGYPELMPGSPPPRPDSYATPYGQRSPASVPYSYSPPR